MTELSFLPAASSSHWQECKTRILDLIKLRLLLVVTEKCSTHSITFLLISAGVLQQDHILVLQHWMSVNFNGGGNKHTHITWFICSGQSNNQFNRAQLPEREQHLNGDLTLFSVIRVHVFVRVCQQY